MCGTEKCRKVVSLLLLLQKHKEERDNVEGLDFILMSQLKLMLRNIFSVEACEASL